MEDRITSGPWVVAKDSGAHLAITNANGCHNIALVFGNSVRLRESMANARLIAAAPEMLLVLEEARRTIAAIYTCNGWREGLLYPDGAPTWLGAWVDDIDRTAAAAIAKAKGE